MPTCVRSLMRRSVSAPLKDSSASRIGANVYLPALFGQLIDDIRTEQQWQVVRDGVAIGCIVDATHVLVEAFLTLHL